MTGENRRTIIEACKGTAIEFHQACIGRDQKDRWGRPGEIGFDTPEDWSRLFDENLPMVRELEYVKKYTDPPTAIRSLEELPYSKDKEFVHAIGERGKTRRKRQGGAG